MACFNVSWVNLFLFPYFCENPKSIFIPLLLNIFITGVFIISVTKGMSKVCLYVSFFY